MSLNFYLPNYNAAIEYLGIQYYKAAIGIFTKEIGKSKCQLCKCHGISIHCVKHNENVSENIES